MPLTKHNPYSPSRVSPSGRDTHMAGFHPFKGRVSRHFGESVRPSHPIQIISQNKQRTNPSSHR